MYQTIKDFKNKGVTILFVSHNMSDVEKICDRVVWIEDHKLREIGSAERIIELYNKQWLNNW
jgi:lipopolysaccharide transport system ATP-binding protein